MSRILVVLVPFFLASCQTDINWLPPTYGQCEADVVPDPLPLAVDDVLVAAAFSVDEPNTTDGLLAGAQVKFDHSFVADGAATVVDFGPSGERCEDGDCWSCPVGTAMRVPVVHTMVGSIGGDSVEAASPGQMLYATAADPTGIFFVVRDWREGAAPPTVSPALEALVDADPSLSPCAGLDFRYWLNGPPNPDSHQNLAAASQGGGFSVECPEQSDTLASW